MAETNRFYIGMLDANASLQTNLKSFAIPDNAFAQLINAYVWRGRVKKRFGARLMEGTIVPTSGLEQIQSRLKIAIATTDAGGNLGAIIVPGSITGSSCIGQAFSVGNNFFTVSNTGTPTTLLTTGPGTGTYDTTTGSVILAGSNALTTVYFYPSQSVMGLVTYEQSGINAESTVAFDTQFAYQFGANGWIRLGTATWTGTNSDFFWGTNYRGIANSDVFLYVTNYVAADVIKYYDGSNWNNMSPIVDNTNRILTTRIIVPFKNRLVFLNTIEKAEGIQFSAPNITNATTGNFNQTVAGAYVLGQQFIVGNTIFTIASNAAGLQNMTVASLPGLTNPPTAQFNFATGNLIITGNNNNLSLPVYFFDGSSGSSFTYGNRCRFSLNGDPTLANGWISQQPGLGGFIDAPTAEAIVTAQLLKDRLIVYFESSTWELVYTGNQTLPFIWQKINTELGAESTFSQVPFDKVILGVGNVGIHACNGSNVERIDDKIPDSVFEIHNESAGIKRVAGIRDYFAEMVYWTFPDENQSDIYPFNNNVLVYNYKTGSWAFNDDSITAFGYFQSSGTSQYRWEDVDETWEEADFTWTSPQLQGQFRNVIAGNQEGFVFIVDVNESSNCQALQITNLTYSNVFSATFVSVNHNLRIGEYVKVENCTGVTGLNNTIVQVTDLIDANTFKIAITAALTGIYSGAGTLTKVTPPDIVTKQYNFYASSGRNAYVSKVDCLVTSTASGQCTVDYYVSSSPVGILQQLSTTTTLPGSSILETSPYTLVPYEAQQLRLWHPVYLWADGEYIQMRFYLTPAQATNVSIAESFFELHAMIFYATPTSSRLQ